VTRFLLISAWWWRVSVRSSAQSSDSTKSFSAGSHDINFIFWT
jgi:hypothetical protein